MTTLTKNGEALTNNLESLFLTKRAATIINLLSEHLLMKETLLTALSNPNLWKSPENIDKIANECREITFRVNYCPF